MWVDTIIIERLEELAETQQRIIERTEKMLRAHRRELPDTGERRRKNDE